MKSARHRAMDLLARREHSYEELLTKLTRKGHDPVEAREALNELAREGLQSDARYAASLIAVRAGRGKGPLRVRADLARAGIPDDLIEEAMAECGVDWRQQARKVLSSKYGKQPPESYTEKARRMRFLNQRGFGMDEIRAAMGEVEV